MRGVVRFGTVAPRGCLLLDGAAEPAVFGSGGFPSLAVLLQSSDRRLYASVISLNFSSAMTRIS